MVIFGVTGDLAPQADAGDLRPGQPWLLPSGFALVGFARRDWADEDFAKIVYDAVRANAAHTVPRGRLAGVVGRVPIRPGHLRRRRRVRRLAATVTALDGSAAPTATTPSTSRSRRPRSRSCDQLKRSELAQPHDGRWRRVVIEKPFGHDLASARKLNAVVNSGVPEHSVFRIDHYLGKETVQNILALRFANQLSTRSGARTTSTTCRSPWPRTSVSGGRAGYYDGIGAARDVIQNHLLQLLALVAMEEPCPSTHPRSCRPRRSKVLSAPAISRLWIAELRPRAVRPGWQGNERCGLPGGREGFAKDSATGRTRRSPRGRHDNRRWAGVPFYLRTGKRLGAASPRSPWSSNAPRTCRSIRR